MAKSSYLQCWPLATGIKYIIHVIKSPRSVCYHSFRSCINHLQHFKTVLAQRTDDKLDHFLRHYPYSSHPFNELASL